MSFSHRGVPLSQLAYRRGSRLHWGRGRDRSESVTPVDGTGWTVGDPERTTHDDTRTLSRPVVLLPSPMSESETVTPRGLGSIPLPYTGRTPRSPLTKVGMRVGLSNGPGGDSVGTESVPSTSLLSLFRVGCYFGPLVPPTSRVSQAWEGTHEWGWSKPSSWVGPQSLWTQVKGRGGDFLPHRSLFSE